MVISVPTVLGYQLIRIQVQNANQYIKSLKKTNIDSAHDWNIWIRNNTFDSDVIFIKAQTNKKKLFILMVLVMLLVKITNIYFFQKNIF